MIEFLADQWRGDLEIMGSWWMPLYLPWFLVKWPVMLWPLWCPFALVIGWKRVMEEE